MLLVANYNMLVLKKALLLIAPFISLVSAAPLDPELGPWENPCGGSKVPNPAELDILSGSTPDLQIDLKVIMKKCNVIQEKNSKWCDVIVTTRIQDEEEVQHHRLLPPLTGFPCTNINDTQGMTIPQTLHLYYDRLSTASVFLEQVESEFSPYKNDVECVQRSVVGLLCQLALTLTHLKETLPNSVSREAMPEIYRTLPNTASQDIRNFLISRDLSKLVMSMKTDIGRFVK